MAITLDRLKSQLLTSGLQQENIALFQVINQLIDFLRGEMTATQGAISGGGGGGGGVGLLGATYLTKNKEILLPNSLQTLPGEGIQFNDANGRRIISTAFPYLPDSGGDGEEGPPGPPGRIGIDGATGVDGIPGSQGMDGFEGEIGEWGIPGPMGSQGPVGGNSGRVFWLDITDASDIAGYKKALIAPSPNAEATNVQVCALTTDNLIASFVTEPGIPGVHSIPAGGAFRHIHGEVTTVGGFARYLVELYYCNSDGTGETLVGSSYSPTFAAGGVIEEINWDLYSSVPTLIGITQRLVFKLYIARVAGPANINVTTYFEGTVQPSYLGSTVAGGTVGPEGPIGPMGPPGLAIPAFEPEEPEHPFIIPGPMGPAGSSGSSDWDIVKVKVGNDTVNNSVVLVDDSELITALALNSSYYGEWAIIYSGNNATGDYQFTFRMGGNVTITAQFKLYVLYSALALGATASAFVSANAGVNAVCPTPSVGLGTDAADSKILHTGYFVIQTPAAWAGDGNLAYQFALNAAAVGRIVTTYAGSYFRLKKLA
jgi:hypothetical protein